MTTQPPPKPLRFVTNYGAPHPKRRRIGAACLTCRKRKTACSGEKPHCETCRQNRLDCAGYASEQEKRPNPSSRQPYNSIEIDPALKSLDAIPSPQPRSRGSIAESTQETSLFSGPRNRMPYFRWLGPTAIMPGFKQMVVKIKRHDTEKPSSSPSLHSPPLQRAESNPSFRESDVRSSVSLPSYDSSQMPPSEVITHLAQTFFTHLGCNYPFLQRARFMRDLEEKEVDAILVDAVCALAARFSKHSIVQQGSSPAEYGHAFAQRAKSALMDTFACPTVAAVQAALLLAYNEFGESRDSGLWMYLGIAIRLAQDLGMHKLEGLRYIGNSGITPKMVSKHYDSHYLVSFIKMKGKPQVDPDPRAKKVDVEAQKAAEQERVDTFWAVFFLDRVVSSGTGRTSTLRDKDIEVSFPPLEQEDKWPAPFPALIRIIHLYGRVADLLNCIKEPSDVTHDTPKRLAAMESQVTELYQGLSSKLHFGAESFQHYVKAGEGTNFVLLHFWFHTLIVLLHQPTLFKTFEGKMLQLFPNSQQLSMSSAKTIADILAYSQLVDAKASLGNPFTTQPIYIAACAFLRETADNSTQPRATSSNGNTSKKKSTLLAQAANQHYQRCYKALQSIETYWAGAKYILTVLDQKFEGVGDPLLYTAEESESAMEKPKPDPSFTTPGWRKTFSTDSMIDVDNRFLKALPDRQLDAIGWTLTGTMDSSSTNLARHYATDRKTGLTNLAALRNGNDSQSQLNPTDVSNASLLLELQGSYMPESRVQHDGVDPMAFPATLSEYNGMFIESKDVDMSSLGLDVMPWFDAPFMDN